MRSTTTLRFDPKSVSRNGCPWTTTTIYSVRASTTGLTGVYFLSCLLSCLSGFSFGPPLKHRRSTSLIVAPDSFADRAKVIVHIIKIAQELRNINNYFTSHSLVTGVRQTLWPGDRMFKHFAATPTYKTWLSLELLYGSKGASAAYRLGLKHTVGPAIVDLYVPYSIARLSLAYLLTPVYKSSILPGPCTSLT